MIATAASPLQAQRLLQRPTAALAAPSLDAGTAIGGGHNPHHKSFHLGKRLLLFSLMGALAGAFFPVIPGGPVGGAALGAALACVWRPGIKIP